MAKSFSIIISFLLLIQSFELDAYGIIELEEFIEHAQFHNKQYGDNIFVFISKHYGDLKTAHEKEHQEEKATHDKLPFHNYHVSHLLFIINASSTKIINFNLLSFIDLRKDSFSYKISFSSLHKLRVFHPPQHL